MKLVLFLLKSNKKLMALAALIGLISGGANAALISLISDAFGALERGEPPSKLLFLGFTAVALATGILSQVLIVRLAAKLTARFQFSLCQQILNMPLRKLEEAGIARIMATFNGDIPTITDALLQIPAMFINGAITFGCLVYLGLLSPYVFAALLVFLVFSVASYYLPDRIGARYMHLFREEWDHLFERIVALSKGAKELKLHYYRRDAFLNGELSRSITRMRGASTRFRNFYAVLLNWVSTLYFLFIWYLVFILPENRQMAPAAIAGFTLVVLFIRNPVMLLVDSIPKFRQATVSMDKIRLLGLNLDFQSAEAPLHEKRVFLEQIQNLAPFGTLELKGITHAFFHEREEKHFTLGPINLLVEAGEIVFIIGGNGSGKTTLAKLITGLYEPKSGQILVNGAAVTGRKEHYRQYFSAIFSDFYVFEEIMGLDQETLDERARFFLEKLRLNHKVKVENGRLSTVDLSTGQRKRLALLTCYLEDRPIYLFDEWAADQDPEFKEVFYRHLLPELKQKGKTVFVISHDDRYFEIPDKIIKLADGQLQKTFQAMAPSLLK